MTNQEFVAQTQRNQFKDIFPIIRASLRAYNQWDEYFGYSPDRFTAWLVEDPDHVRQIVEQFSKDPKPVNFLEGD